MTDSSPQSPSEAPAAVRRDVLPIPDAKHVGLTTYDAKDPNTTTRPSRHCGRPGGAGRAMVLIDDAGLGATSAFGGPCNTPTARTARGRRCEAQPLPHHRPVLTDPAGAADRANHHSVGMGAITEMATSAPDNSSIRPKEKAPIAETLKLNGYSTAQFGKCHEVPAWEVSPVGPTTPGPPDPGSNISTALSAARQPVLSRPMRGHHRRRAAKSPEEGYTLNEDLANRAITWVRQQKALMPDKPFFIYYATGATPRATSRAPGMVATNTRASSTKAGMCCGSKSSPRRRSSA